MEHLPGPGLWVVMGVSGAGKTTAGQALAAHLGVPFGDADDLHPAANVAKMQSGVALDDADRAPWLAAVGTWLAERRDGAVMSCSALRRAYRDTLREYAWPVRFLHLAGSAEVVRARVEAREGHYMPASLVESQYAALEPLGDDEDGVTVGFDEPIGAIVARAAAVARRAAPGRAPAA
ncbi:gluconokinase [Sinomonas atrocyanea]